MQACVMWVSHPVSISISISISMSISLSLSLCLSLYLCMYRLFVCAHVQVSKQAGGYAVRQIGTSIRRLASQTGGQGR